MPAAFLMCRLYYLPNVPPVLRFGWNPASLLLVKGEAWRRLKGVLGRIYREIPGTVLHLRMHGVERHSDIFLAGAEETADTDDQASNLAVFADDHVIDGADLVLCWVIDALLVVFGHRLARRRCGHDWGLHGPGRGEAGRSEKNDSCRKGFVHEGSPPTRVSANQRFLRLKVARSLRPSPLALALKQFASVMRDWGKLRVIKGGKPAPPAGS